MQLPTAMPMMFIASLILLISCANCSTESTTERPPSSSSDGKEKAPINPALNTVKKHIETARGVVVPAVKQSIDKYVLPNAKKAGDSAVRGWKAFRRFVRPVVNKAIGGGRAFGERLASMKHWESSGEEEKAEEKKHKEKVEKREEKKAEEKKKKKNKKEHKTMVEKKEQKHEEKKENEAKKEEEELDESKKHEEKKENEVKKEEEELNERKKEHEEKKENEAKKENEELNERKKEQEGHKEEATEVISEVKEKLNVEDIEKKRTELNNIEQQKDDELRKKKGKMIAVDTENDFEHEAKKEGTEWKMSLGPNDFDDEKTSSSSDSGSDESSK